MNHALFQKLHEEALIDDQQLQRVHDYAFQPRSVHWDLKTLLYAGILLLTTGLGILVYKNIQTIGHLAIVISIAVAMLLCYAYSFTKAGKFSLRKTASPTIVFDYVLLAASLLLLILVGYLQFQYQLFGNRWGLATFFPMIILFFTAYYFDHLGILSMAIINLAAWFGITVTPLRMLEQNDFSSERIILSGIELGVLLIVLSVFSVRMKIKEHFSFTYKNFGVHILCIAMIAAIIHYNHWYILFFMLLAGIAAYLFTQSLQEKSFYFLVVATIYFYIGLSYVVIYSLSIISSIGELELYIGFLYLLGSSIALVMFLIRYNRLIKSYDSIRR
jgi:hypothetical protein